MADLLYEGDTLSNLSVDAEGSDHSIHFFGFCSLQGEGYTFLNTLVITKDLICIHVTNSIKLTHLRDESAEP